MTSVLKRLAGISNEAAVVDIGNASSLATVDESPYLDIVQEADEHLLELDNTSRELGDAVTAVEHSVNVAESFESLVMGTIDTYKQYGISDQALQQYEICVESLMISSGLNLPVHIASISLESKEEESGDSKTSVSKMERLNEIKDRAGKFIKSIWKWISELFTSIYNIVSRFISKITASTKVVRNLSEQIKKEAETLSGEPKSNKIKLGGYRKYLNDGNGNIKANAAEFLKNDLIGSYNNFLDKYKDFYQPIVSKMEGSLQREDIKTGVNKVMDFLNKGEIDKVNFTPLPYVGLEISVDKTKHRGLYASYFKLEFSYTERKVQDEASTLDIAVIKSLVQGIADAAGEMDKMAKHIEEQNEIFKKIAKVAKNISDMGSMWTTVPSHDEESNFSKLEFISSIKYTLHSVAKVIPKGYVNTYPDLARSVVAVGKYALASCSQYKGE